MFLFRQFARCEAGFHLIRTAQTAEKHQNSTRETELMTNQFWRNTLQPLQVAEKRYVGFITSFLHYPCNSSRSMSLLYHIRKGSRNHALCKWAWLLERCCQNQNKTIFRPPYGIGHLPRAQETTSHGTQGFLARPHTILRHHSSAKKSGSSIGRHDWDWESVDQPQRRGLWGNGFQLSLENAFACIYMHLCKTVAMIPWL